MSKDETGPLVPRNRLAMNAGRRPRADAASDALANLSNATLLRTSASVEANSTVGIDVGVDVGVKDAETTRGGGGDGGDKVGVRPDEVETTGVGLPASRASADQDQETDDGGDDDAASSTESVRAANATSGTNAASASARTRRRWTRPASNWKKLAKMCVARVRPWNKITRQKRLPRDVVPNATLKRCETSFDSGLRGNNGLSGLQNLPERAKRGLGPIIRIVERSFFGGRPVDSDGWLEARASYEDFAFGEGWA